MSRARGWDPTVGELADYFRTTESVNGLSSSWEPLVGIAQGGAVSSADPEARFLAGGRFALGPKWNTAVSQHREVREALRRLPLGDPSAIVVLWAAHGPVQWGRVVDGGLGTGMAGKIAEYLDPRLYGVALLTPEFKAATQSWGGPAPLKDDDKRSAHPAWRTPGSWLADLVLVAKSRSKRVTDDRRSAAVATLSEVGRSAGMLLRIAEDAYRDARGSPPAPLGPSAPRRARRARRLEGLEGVEFSVGMGDRKR